MIELRWALHQPRAYQHTEMGRLEYRTLGQVIRKEPGHPPELTMEWSEWMPVPRVDCAPPPPGARIDNSR